MSTLQVFGMVRAKRRTLLALREVAWAHEVPFGLEGGRYVDPNYRRDRDSSWSLIWLSSDGNLIAAQGALGITDGGVGGTSRTAGSAPGGRVRDASSSKTHIGESLGGNDVGCDGRGDRGAGRDGRKGCRMGKLYAGTWWLVWDAAAAPLCRAT